MLFCGVNSKGTVDGYAALVLSGQISNSDFILYIGSSNGLTLVRSEEHTSELQSQR